INYRMKKLIILFVLMLFASIVNAQTTYKNYVKETVYRTESNSGGGWVLAGSNNFENIIYYDGLSRPEQIIEKNASPVNEKNIVKHIEYVNNIGKVKDFMPFTVEGKTTINIGGGFTQTNYNADFVNYANSSTLNYYNTEENEFTQNP